MAKWQEEEVVREFKRTHNAITGLVQAWSMFRYTNLLRLPDGKWLRWM